MRLGRRSVPRSIRVFRMEKTARTHASRVHTGVPGHLASKSVSISYMGAGVEEFEPSVGPWSPLHVFLSYAREDTPAMDILDRQMRGLVKQGLITLFIDKSLRPGDVWHDRIRAELERADVVVFLLSDHLMGSDYVLDNEYDYVLKELKLDKGRPRPVTLLIDDVPKHNGFSQWEMYAKRDNQLLPVKYWGLEEKRPYIQVVDYVGELAERHREQQMSSSAVSADSISVDLVDGIERSPAAAGVGGIKTKWRWENRPAGHLCARKDLVSRINARLESEPGVAVVLTGHGGMGKSTAAYLYAATHDDRYDHVAKIAAESPEILAEEWRSLAEWLDLPASDVLSADYALKEWLAKEQRWLLVLDNAYGIEALDRLPELPMGDVLVTTRERFTGLGDFRLLTVGELDESEAENLLLEAAGAGADLATVREICAIHSYEPLALEKALLDLRGGMAPRRYLARLRAHER